MTREELYKSDRGERAYYKSTEDDELMLPLTEDGFEALLEKAAAVNDLVIDDQLRSLLAGYIHHIPSEVPTLYFNEVKNVFYKHFANTMTFKLDQEAKKRAQDALKQKEDSNVVPINGA